MSIYEDIQRVSTSLSLKDHIGAWKARWGINRDDYTVDPGIYAVGTPNPSSPVLVSANYKLTFDILRKNLTGLDCWLLILDTRGVNVWCASGKGTFGAEELIERIDAVGLHNIVSHRKIILPQLGASGVNAREVAAATGFSVAFGPVRAEDIKTYITSGFKATKEMRAVKFTFRDRLVLTPMEFVEAARISLTVFGVLFLINLIATRPFGAPDFIAYMSAVLAGSVLTPLLLPYLPGAAFSIKGWTVGVICTAALCLAFGWFAPPNTLLGIGYMLILPSLSAFLAMNFTGASTYTSPSGVLKEMKIAIPLMLLSSAAGAVMLLIKIFMG